MEQIVQGGIGQRIAEARRGADLTQQGLANAVGVKLRTVGAWEGNERHPRRGALAAIARVTGHDVAWFYANHDSEAAAA
jgi:transcriptional regulator with XRE-family HTH domain